MATAQRGALQRRLRQSILAIVALMLLAYPVDWTIWRVRIAMGSGMGSVRVTTTTAATLKGNHFEVYGQEATAVDCSRSLLPQAGSGACWWLRRHPQLITQY